MLVSFVKGYPALMINKERFLVVGDLHIGKEFKLAKSGLHFPNASQRMAEQLLKIYKETGAKGIIFLGDIKESIGYPQKDESDAIASFFHIFRNVSIMIVKGNHDAHIGELLRRIEINTFPVNELLLKRVALIHGNAMPSPDALKRDYIISGHSHTAIEVNGRSEKGWLVAKIGNGAKKKYKFYNKDAKLVVMPAFNGLITGVRVNPENESSLPLLRNKVFDPKTIRLFDLNKKEIR